MRAEMAMPRGAEGVHPASEGVWRVLATTVGPAFSHNMFVMAARKAGVGREQARRDFRVLSQRYNGHRPQEDPTMTQTTTREQTPVPVLAEAPELAALRRTVEAQATELRELRNLVETIPMDGRALPPRLAKLEAQLASLWRIHDEQEQRMDGLVKVLDGQSVTIMHIEEFFVKLRTDPQMWEACLNLARVGSQGTHSAVLKDWLARAAGRSLSDNDKVSQ